MIYLLLSDVFEISQHNLWIITDQDSVAVLWFNLSATQHHAAIPSLSSPSRMGKESEKEIKERKENTVELVG